MAELSPTRTFSYVLGALEDQAFTSQGRGVTEPQRVAHSPALCAFTRLTLLEYPSVPGTGLAAGAGMGIGLGPCRPPLPGLEVWSGE